MSADQMVICQEFENSFQQYIGNRDKKVLPLCIGETSMGMPHKEFGSWFAERFCGAPGILEQLAGLREHSYTLFTEADLIAVGLALESMETQVPLTMEDFQQFVGKHISTENW